VRRSPLLFRDSFLVACCEGIHVALLRAEAWKALFSLLESNPSRFAPSIYRQLALCDLSG
jgi:hypothetical protein